MADKSTFRSGLLGIGCWLLACVAALKFGAVSDASAAVVMQLRFPRVLLAATTGLGLSVAGAVLQAMFSNPLCEPYTLGISSGAAVGAVLGAMFGLDLMIAGLAGPAFGGAIVFAAILYLIARRWRTGNLVLLLSGVMLSFLGSSIVALWMALTDANGVQAAVLWLMGDLSRARFSGSLVSLGGVIVLTWFIWARSRDLDALLVGEETAAAVGVDVTEVRKRMLVLVSLIVALCVSGAGMIGFIGLVVPHFVRRSVGSLHRALIPLSAIWGAAVMVAADAVARFAIKPYDLPVGVVTSVIGAPLFLWIMLGRRKETL